MYSEQVPADLVGVGDVSECGEQVERRGLSIPVQHRARDRRVLDNVVNGRQLQP